MAPLLHCAPLRVFYGPVSVSIRVRLVIKAHRLIAHGTATPYFCLQLSYNWALCCGLGIYYVGPVGAVGW